MLLYLGSGDHGDCSTRFFVSHKGFMMVNDRWTAVILSSANLNNNLQCKQDIIILLHETMEHLKTESEHLKNEVENQREVIKVLRESYYDALFCMLSLQRPYVQIFQNLLFCIFWNFSTATIFWQQIYGRMSILMYRKLRSKVSKYCQFILQKPYVQRLDLMSKRWTYGPFALFLWKTLSPYLEQKALVRTTLCPFMDCSLDIRLIIAAVKALCPKYNFTKTLSPSQDLKSLDFL